MNDWSSVLQAHVAAASPPPFEDVVRRVRRRRQRQVVGAALAGLVVIAGTALAVGRTTPGPRENLPATATAPPTMTVKGLALKRDKQLSFTTAMVTGRSDHSIVVLAGTRPVRPDGCHPWSMPYVLRQDESRVVVGVFDYVLASGDTSCFTYGLGTARLPLELGRSLGSRRVVDAGSGRDVTVLDRSSYLTSPQAPSGFQPLPAAGGRNAGWTVPHYDQMWQGPSGALLTLTEGPPGEVLRVHVQHIGATAVRGRPAELVRTAGGDANRCLRWRESANDALELCSRGYTQYVLTVAQLVAFANALHRP